MLLAAILMTACEAATPISESVVVVATSTSTSVPVNTPTDVPNPTPLPSETPLPSPTSSPTPLPSETPTPTPIPAPTTTPVPTVTPMAVEIASGAVGIQVYKTTITLPTYPIRDYLTEQIDPVYNLPVYYFQRQTYEPTQPTPTPVDYTGVVLENEYLRLTFLPELGGRLYSALIKATGQEIFYHNKVVKPSRYGILEPYEANWWLATGGMDWAYPTQEHGYRFGVPWDYSVTTTANSATVTLSDIAPDRVGVEVQVTLPADGAVFTVNATLTNNTDHTVPVQFWLNAALALAPDTMSPNTRFTLPTDEIVVHSRGEEGWDIPNEKETAPWPEIGTTNLSYYNQWADYLGFFIPYMDHPFMGAYNPETDLGVVRLVKPGEVPGNKLFAFGPAFLDRSYADDDSQYFEIWGGANTGFWPEDDVAVPAGDSLQWQESWWPLAGLGGITWANEHAAIFVSQDNNDYNLSLAVTHPLKGTIRVWAGKTTLLTEPFQATPSTPLPWNFTADQPVTIQITDNNDTLILEY